MLPARNPLGRKTGLSNSKENQTPAAVEDGFLDVPMAKMIFGYGTCMISEWVPDQAQRAALGAGARVRIVMLTKTPIPVKVGVATSLPSDTPDLVNKARYEMIASRLFEEMSGRPWSESTLEEHDFAMLFAKKAVEIACMGVEK